jgi:uncharacterized DUF497 family protein
MVFVFDAEQSTVNKARHGMDFLEAQQLWQDMDRLVIPARTLDAPRYQVIGRIGSTIWVACITYRYEKIHILSVRRARFAEEARYRAD